MVVKVSLTNTLLAGAAAVAMFLPLAVPATAAVGGNSQPQASPAAAGSAIEVVPARDPVNRSLHDPSGRDAGQINGIVVGTDSTQMGLAQSNFGNTAGSHSGSAR